MTLYVNMIPEQGTATVRTEEALLASLAVFNLQFNLTNFLFVTVQHVFCLVVNFANGFFVDAFSVF